MRQIIIALSIIICSYPETIFCASDIRGVRWGASMDEVMSMEPLKPLVISKENEFGHNFEVLLYHTVETALEADVRYLFADGALRLVSVEYAASDPDTLYAELVDVFLKKCTRGEEVESALQRMAQTLKKYPHVRLPKDAVNLLADPEKSLGLAAFENGRTSIRIPFKHRENLSVVPVYYIDTDYLRFLQQDTQDQ